MYLKDLRLTILHLIILTAIANMKLTKTELSRKNIIFWIEKRTRNKRSMIEKRMRELEGWGYLYKAEGKNDKRRVIYNYHHEKLEELQRNCPSSWLLDDLVGLMGSYREPEYT